MPTQAEIEAYREAQENVAVVAQAALASWFLDLPDRLSLDSLSAALRRFLPPLVRTYGSASATIAADWYEDLRDAAGVPGVFTPEVGEPVTVERAEAGARWSTSPRQVVTRDPNDTPDDPNADPDDPDTPSRVETREPTRDEVSSKASIVVQRFVQEPGRDTITDSVLADPGKPRWARVPQGETCAWCLVMASRGAVYLTAETAGAMNRYHTACDCQPTPSWDGEVPYDVDALYETYNRARNGSGSGDIKAITKWLRANEGLA